MHLREVSIAVGDLSHAIELFTRLLGTSATPTVEVRQKPGVRASQA